MKARVSTVASALLLCSWAPLGIAGTDPAAAGKPSSEEMILFQELPSVFGASKYEQKPSEAPASVSVVTADEIQKYGYRTLSDILRSVRGIFTTYDRNYSYAGVRGFDRPGDYDTRILLLLDGHRLNDDVYDQAMIGTEAPIDVEVIDHVEIIRGPSSSLYGTDAFFAVVNVVTKSGRQMQGGEVAVEGSSYSTGRGRYAYGKKLDTGREILLSGTFYDSGGQRLFFPEFDSPATDNGFADRADDDRYGRLFGKLSVGDLTLEAGASSREKGIPTASFGTVFDDPSSRTVDSRGFLDLRYDRTVSDATRLITSVSYDAYRYNGDYLYTTGLAKDYGYGQWWTAEGRAISTLGERQKLIYGAEFRYNAQQDQGYYQVSPYASYLKDRRHSTIGALYVQDEIRLRPKVILNLGVRHDRYDNFGGTTNPRLAFIAGLGQASTLKLL